MNAHIYLGRTADREFVWAEVNVEYQPGPHTTTDHEVIDGIERVSISFITAMPKFRGDPERFAREPYLFSNDGFDRVSLGWGQVRQGERVITEFAADQDTVAFIEGVWQRWHLNDMRAGCAHQQEGYDFTIPTDEHERHGKPDEMHWKLHYVRCDVTGYRWGFAWLAEVVPPDVLDRLRHIITEHANARSTT